MKRWQENIKRDDKMTKCLTFLKEYRNFTCHTFCAFEQRHKMREKAKKYTIKPNLTHILNCWFFPPVMVNVTEVNKKKVRVRFKLQIYISCIHIFIFTSSFLLWSFNLGKDIFRLILRLINIRHVYTWLQAKRVRFRFVRI